MSLGSKGRPTKKETEVKKLIVPIKVKKTAKEIAKEKKAKAKERAEWLAWKKKDRAETKVRLANENRARIALVKKYPLPKPLILSDLKRASYNSKDEIPYEEKTIIHDATWTGCFQSFEVWYSQGFGWCFPTLLIKNATRNSNSSRTYAVTTDGKLVRIGAGPHILAKTQVYLKKSNLERLSPILELLRKGSSEANVYRDNLSTRRARRRGYW